MTESTQRIAELERELAANPASRQFYQLGELLRRDGHHKEAANVLHAGLAHHPRYVAAWVALGRAYLETEAAEAAEAALDQAIGLDAQNPVAWRLLGEARLARGDRFAALEAMGHALELVPGDEVLQAAVESLASHTAPPPVPRAARETRAAAEVFAAPPPTTAAAPALFGDPFATLSEPEAAAQTTAPDVFAESAAAPVVEPPPWTEAPQQEVAPGSESAGPATAAPGAELAAPAMELGPSAAAPAASPHRPGQPVETTMPPAQRVSAIADRDTIDAGPAAQRESPEVSWESSAVAAAAFPETGPEPPPRQPVESAVTVGPPGPSVTEEASHAPAAEPAAAQAPATSPVSEGDPPATLTLARLYIQQHDLEEAAHVLERLCKREPANREARDLLDLVRDMMSPLSEAVPVLSRTERKIAALQRWLARFTAARERTSA